ncbi:YqzE family protein [Brevibacillus humidisoli]|uniref:YqzE family protein n=1 Tax=Brevibacillus humidisoli TaxID=2895522 RepID=UPI001E2D3679|nr:YqzE family protein [Brevibacillus humidisoli]UFJ42950.1 YqzE family protein [Brevibacillus humidisoli]
MSFQDYLKYLIKRLLEYMETPADERKRRKEMREAWTARWFGMIPLSIKMFLRK